MGDKPRKFLLMFVIALMLMLSFSDTAYTDSLRVVTPRLNTVRSASNNLFGRSNITVNAYENVTFAPRNNSVDLGSFSQIRPTALSIDVVKGFEPTDRFNSPYNYSFVRETNSGNNSLRKVDDGLQLLFNTKNKYQPSISLYNMSFVYGVNVSRSDFLSLAISTPNSFDSSDGYVGIALLLRDEQGSRQYVFIHISNVILTDEYGLSPWFLGESYGGKQYPEYNFRYHSSFGPWFIQLALLDSFSYLNLSSAWLDGLLIGGELFSIPMPYETTQVDARFHYVLVHQQPFSINQEMVNSTELILPPTNYINISGIPCKTLNAIITGPLKPAYQTEEEQENKTVKVVDVFYNISQPFFYNFSEAELHEAIVEGRVNITVLSKLVRKCMITINNITDVDLTEQLLRSDNGLIYSFISHIQSVRVFLILYEFNSWLFNPASTTLGSVTKRGITEEYFVPESNESVVVIDSTKVGLEEASIAVGAGYFSSGEVSANGVVEPLNSLIVVNSSMFLVTTVKFEGNGSPYTIKCSFNSDPIYDSFTIQPFKVFIDKDLFWIYTPFSIEAEPRVQIPLTLGVSTSMRTYTVKINYDSSMLKVDNDELMINKLRGAYEYFMLKPIGLGTTEFTVHFIGPGVENSDVTIPFLVSINYSLSNQIITYVVLIVTILSIVYVIVGKNIADWLLHRNEGKKTLQ